MKNRQKEKILKPEVLLNMLEDIEESNTKIKESEKRYRNLVESTNNLVQSVNPDGSIAFANRAWLNTLGYRKEDVPKLNVFRDIINPPGVEHCAKLFKRLMAGEKIDNIETEFRTKKGGIIIVEGNVTLNKVGGKVVSTYGIWKDITEKRKAEEALKENEEKFRNLFETMAQGAVYQDAKGRITSANAAAERILGLTFSQMIGRTSADPRWKAVHEDGSDFPGKDHPSMAALKTGKKVKNVIMGVFNPKTGKYVWIRINAVPKFREGEKKPYEVYTTLSDITQIKNSQKEVGDSEMKFRRLFEAAQDSILIVDASTGQIRDANPFIQKMLGFSRNEILGKRLWEIGPVKDIVTNREKFEKLKAEKYVRYENLPLETKEGKEITAEFVSNVYKVGDREVIQCNIRDSTAREKAKDELIKEKEWSEALINSAPNIVVGLGKKSRILLFNRFAEKLTGYRAGEVVGKRWIDLFIPKEMQKQVYGVWGRIVKNMLVEHHYENPVKTRDGKERIISWSNTVLTENGKFRMVLSIGEDVTEKKKAEEELAEEKERLASILENAQVGIGIVDFYHNFLDANPTFCRILGYSVNELRKMTFRDFTYPEDLEESRKLVGRLMAGKINTFALEKRYVRKDKKVICGSVKLTSIRNRSGKFLYNIVSLEDVTARKKAEEALKESEEKYKNLAEKANDILYSYDSKGTLTYIGPQIKKYGISPEEIISKKIFDIVADEDRKRVIKDFEKTIRTGHEFPTAFRAVNKKGDVIWLEEYGKAIKDKNGKIIRVTGVLRDITDRKKAEEALEESEKRFRGIFNSSADAIFVADTKTKMLVDCNAQAVALMGFSKDKILKMRADHLHPRDMVGETMKKFERQAKGEMIIVESEVLTKKKERVPVSINTSVMKIGGKPYLVGIFRDITERKKAEEALKKSEERFRALFEYAPDAYYLNDMNGTFIDGNRAAERVTGYRREEIIGKSMLRLKLIRLSQVPKAAALLARNRMGLPTGPEEFTIRRKDGKEVPVEIITHPIELGGRKVALGIARDITERKKAEEKIMESENRRLSVMDNMMEGCQIIGFDWKYLYLNRTAVRDARKPQKELLGHTIMKCYPGIEKTKMFGVLKKCMKSRRTYSMLNEFKYTDGSKGWFELSIQPSVEGIFILSKEVTDRKKAEEEVAKSHEKVSDAYKRLMELDRMKDEFVSAAGHQLKTPLTPIIGYLDLIPPGARSLNEMQSEAVEMAKKNAEKLKMLIDDILSSMNLQSASLKMEKSGFVLRQLIKKVLRNYEPVLAERGISVSEAYPKKEVQVYADSKKIETVISNLIDNSVKYNKEGGNISLIITKQNRLVKVTVGDTGMGIKIANLEKVFTRFFQENVSLPGTGLGLSICKSIVEAHGGKIWAESKGKGLGTRITFTLPLHGANSKEQKTNNNKTQHEKRPTQNEQRITNDEERVAQNK